MHIISTVIVIQIEIGIVVGSVARSPTRIVIVQFEVEPYPSDTPKSISNVPFAAVVQFPVPVDVSKSVKRSRRLHEKVGVSPSRSA